MDGADAIEDALGVRVPDDDRLWVRLKPGWTPDPDWKWRIFGSAQTYAGHFHVCAIGHDEQHRSVNVADVAEFAPAARLWLSGFLAGQEITQFQFMGSSVELLDTMTEADEDRWRAWNVAFRRRGYELSLDELPEVDEPALATAHDPPAWAFIAGQFWTYSETGWAPADPQPAPFSGDQPARWPGTVCVERGHHDMDLEVGEVVLRIDCHAV